MSNAERRSDAGSLAGGGAGQRSKLGRRSALSRVEPAFPDERGGGCARVDSELGVDVVEVLSSRVPRDTQRLSAISAFVLPSATTRSRISRSRGVSRGKCCSSSRSSAPSTSSTTRARSPASMRSGSSSRCPASLPEPRRHRIGEPDPVLTEIATQQLDRRGTGVCDPEVARSARRLPGSTRAKRSPRGGAVWSHSRGGVVRGGGSERRGWHGLAR